MFILPTTPNGQRFTSESDQAGTSEDPILKTRSTHFNPGSTFFTGTVAGVDFNKMLSGLKPEQIEEAALEKIKSLKDYQELTVLHELYHAAEKVITNDSADKSKGRDIDRLIQKNCF